MGLISRKKSGNIFGGSKLNVPGQGIYNVKIIPNDPTDIANQLDRKPRPSQTPKPTPTPTQTPTPTSTQTPTPTLTSTPSPTQTLTSTPTPTPTPTLIDVCLLAQENYDNILTENSNFILVDCPPTPSVTPTQTSTPTQTPTETPTQTPTPTETETPTPTPTMTETPTQTPTPTQTIAGLDPIALSPLLYYQTFDTSFLEPSSPILGDSILKMYKYTDSLQTATGTSECVATWDTLNSKDMLYFPGNNGGCWPPPCTGNCASEYYLTDDINFMHKSGYEYTIYCVAKPLSGYVFSDLNYDSNPHESFYIDSNFDVRFRVETGAYPSLVMFDMVVENNGNQPTIEGKDLRIFSIRAEAPVPWTPMSIGAISYVNGVQTNTTTLLNAASLNADSTPLRIGSVDLDPGSASYKGYLAELIIFNTIHTITDHDNIILFLKNRWGIT